MPIEETFRDWHSGWGVRTAVVKLPTEAMVDRLIGVVCLTYNLQMHLGQRVSVDPRGQQRRAQMTVKDPGGWVLCGPPLVDDLWPHWRGLARKGESVGQPVAAVQATPRPEPALEEAA